MNLDEEGFDYMAGTDGENDESERENEDSDATESEPSQDEDEKDQDYNDREEGGAKTDEDELMVDVEQTPRDDKIPGRPIRLLSKTNDESQVFIVPIDDVLHPIRVYDWTPECYVIIPHNHL